MQAILGHDPYGHRELIVLPLSLFLPLVNNVTKKSWTGSATY